MCDYSPEAANELRDIEGAVRSGTPMSSPETVNQGLSTGDLYHSQSPRAGREAGDGEIPDCHLEIRTNPYGDNQGRKYMLRAVSPDETTLWTQAIREQVGISLVVWSSSRVEILGFGHLWLCALQRALRAGDQCALVSDWESGFWA